MIPLRDLNPTSTRPWLTYGLIAANVAVFAHQFMLSDDAAESFVFRYGVIPRMLTHDVHLSSLSTPFTSMFLHGNLVHLLSNMWFMHIFADNVEEALGRTRFALLYLGSGLLAAVAQVLVGPDSMIPMVGASGAIAGVLGAYFRLFPRARVLALIPIVFFFIVRELPAVFFIVVWFLLQLVSGVGSLSGVEQQGGIAFFAHIGGFLGGLLLLGALGMRRNGRAGFRSASDYRERRP